MSDWKPTIKTEIPGPKSKAIIDMDRSYSSPSYIKEYNLVVHKGQGAYIEDPDGNRFLDMMAGIAVNSTGYLHPKVVSAIKNAADKVWHICTTDFYFDSFSQLCKRLGNTLPGMGPKKVFLTNSGTEAVEGAIKLVRHHTKRSKLIAFDGAFHGRTLGAISLNGSKAKYRAHFGPLLPDVHHVPYPDSYRRPAGQSEEEHACKAAQVIENHLFVNFVQPDEVAAIFVEPILGEGGYIPPHPTFLKELRRICDENGIMLVYDEVQSGVGRTGHMYAADYYGIYPDVLCTAKGLGSGMPIGAIIAKESVMTWPGGSHGSTYGGNAICCEAALATLDVVEELLPQIRSNGEILLAGLRELQKKYPVIGDVRGTGLMIGAELIHPKDKSPDVDLMVKIEHKAFSKGLCLLGCGVSTIRFAPPLVITAEDIKLALEILDESIKELI